MYRNMEFVEQIKSQFIRHKVPQVRSFCIMCCKTTLDHYKDWPVKTERWMYFEVPMALEEHLGRTVSVELTEDMYMNVRILYK